MKRWGSKFIIIIALSFLLLGNSTSNAYASHKHDFGPTQYYKTTYVGGNDIKHLKRCAKRIVYDIRICKTCGYRDIFKASTKRMQHVFADGKCIYCKLGYGTCAINE